MYIYLYIVSYFVLQGSQGPDGIAGPQGIPGRDVGLALLLSSTNLGFLL